MLTWHESMVICLLVLYICSYIQFIWNFCLPIFGFACAVQSINFTFDNSLFVKPKGKRTVYYSLKETTKNPTAVHRVGDKVLSQPLIIYRFLLALHPVVNLSCILIISPFWHQTPAFSVDTLIQHSLKTNHNRLYYFIINIITMLLDVHVFYHNKLTIMKSFRLIRSLSVSLSRKQHAWLLLVPFRVKWYFFQIWTFPEYIKTT